MSNSSNHKRKEQALMQCFREMAHMIHSKDCHPILLRLAWSDAGTYDQSIKKWPQCGGTTGSIRFDRELSHPANAGLTKAMQYLKPLYKEYHKFISWADLIQMAGALAVELSGGPCLQHKMLYGRKDAPSPKERTIKHLASETAVEGIANPNAYRNLSHTDESSLHHSMKWGSKVNGRTSYSDCLASRLPVADPPYPNGVPTAEAHIRHTFYRLGFKNREIVALCGAHTLGRAFRDRSGFSEYSSGDLNATIYTRQNSIAKV